MIRSLRSMINQPTRSMHFGVLTLNTSGMTQNHFGDRVIFLTHPKVLSCSEKVLIIKHRLDSLAKYEEFVSLWFPKNARIVSFYPGDRGSACIRILASHQECYFDSSMCFRESDDPLFISSDINNDFDKNDYKNYDKVDTLPFLGTGPFKEYIIQEMTSILNWSKKTQSKLWFVASHVVEACFPFEYIHVWVSDEQARTTRFNLEQQKLVRNYNNLLKPNNRVEKHLANPNCFCIDASKLLSLDYNIFEEEYKRIVKRFNFTNNVERVRDFVQLYRKREAQVNEWYKNNSFPPVTF